jgi:2-methylcitrate dehydratase PrpD
LPAPAAGFANATAAHALDFDDLHPGVTHTGVSVVPAALAAAEAAGVTRLDEVFAAVVLGTEVADRMAVATSDGPGVTGWLLTPLCGFFAAAAAAARLTAPDPVVTRHALGFAYVQASGNGQSTLDGALAKRMQPAFAARGGLMAAELARRGLTAPLDSLEGRRGYFHVYHRDRYLPDALTDGLGATWQIEAATYKPYPCCGWTHAALECGAELSRRGVRAEQLTRVTIAVNSQAYESTGTPLPRRYRPATEVDAQFSIPYLFATAFVSGTVRLGDFDAAALARPEVLAVADPVRVVADADLDRLEGRGISPARVRAELADGSVAEAFVAQPLGLGARPLGRAEVERKFQDCCRYAGHDDAFAAAVADIVLNDSARPLSELTGLLGRPR